MRKRLPLVGGGQGRRDWSRTDVDMAAAVGLAIVAATAVSILLIGYVIALMAGWAA